MTDPPRLIRQSLYESPRGYGWRARLAWLVLHAGCRHQHGIVCPHRQYEYDHYLRGSNHGYTSGVLHERGASKIRESRP